MRRAAAAASTAVELTQDLRRDARSINTTIGMEVSFLQTSGI